MSSPALTEEYFIQPTVVLTILDIYLRKPVDKSNVIGILLGTKIDNVTTIEEAFYVSHEMDDPNSVRLDLNSIDRLASAFRLHNSRYQVVGWFTTYTQISLSHQLIQTTLASRFNCPSLLMLVVDPCSSKSKKLSIIGYTHHVLLSEAHTRFSVVPVKHLFHEQECVALDVMINGSAISDAYDAPSYIQSEDILFDETAHELASNLQMISDYIDRVTQSGDAEQPVHKSICRQLTKAFSQISTIDPDTSHDAVIQNKMKDLSLYQQLSLAALREITNAYESSSL